MTAAADSQHRKVVAMLAPSVIRRSFGIGALLLLGIVLAYVAATAGESTAAVVSLAGASVLAFFVAWRMCAATRSGLELTSDGLFTADGILVAALSNVRRIERGMFAFKPSNGFLILLKQPMPGSWNPGLWWRFGRRVGVGGVTPRAEGKAMAEAMALLIGLNESEKK